MKWACDGFEVRSWRFSDEASLMEHANNRKIWLQLRDRFPHPYTREDARRWLESAVGRAPETDYAIAVGGEAVGGIGFTLRDDVERVSAEIGYWLGESFWGRGIATGAIRAVTEHAMTVHDLTRVYALPFAGNLASHRALEKAGYVCEGRLRQSALKDGRVLDQLLYAFTREP